MEYNFGKREHRENKERQELQLSGEIEGEIERLRYLESTMQIDKNFEEHIKHKNKYG